jgi:hypothetical protein
MQKKKRKKQLKKTKEKGREKKDSSVFHCGLHSKKLIKKKNQKKKSGLTRQTRNLCHESLITK